LFTGIIERVSKVVELNTVAEGMRLKVFSEAVSSTSGILTPWQDLSTGESISVDGVCLSLIETGDFLAFDVIEESLRRTSLGDLQCGDLVNLERSLKIGDRLGGHYVTGHIDTRGRITAQEGDEETMWRIEHDREAPFRTVSKGSVAVDGVSLTVVDSAADHFTVALIPHTLAVTSFGTKKVGDLVNLEMDHFGRWVEALLADRGGVSS
jgi:riboflavin synthase